MSLADQKCEPCHGGTPKLAAEEISKLLEELNGWTLDNNPHLIKSVKTKDFMRALELANKIGAIAEEAGHHPDLLVRWGELRIEMWTHAIDGLSRTDFVLAAKIDKAITA